MKVLAQLRTFFGLGRKDVILVEKLDRESAASPIRSLAEPTLKYGPHSWQVTQIDLKVLFPRAQIHIEHALFNFCMIVCLFVVIRLARPKYNCCCKWNWCRDLRSQHSLMNRLLPLDNSAREAYLGLGLPTDTVATGAFYWIGHHHAPLWHNTEQSRPRLYLGGQNSVQLWPE